ncbi:MAG: hypothetical protein IPQ04_05275 [Saprospiraceae bacterium]|nr:hypothetical protein [Saprospiraceae bacterium]
MKTNFLFFNFLRFGFGSAIAQNQGNSFNVQFKDLVLNSHNGGVFLLGTDSKVYHTGFHYNNLAVANTTNNVVVSKMTGSCGGHGFFLSPIGILTNVTHESPQLRPVGTDWPFTPVTNYVVGDDIQNCAYWYLDNNSNIKNGTNADGSNVPPAKKTKLFVVNNNEFYMTDDMDDIYWWKPGMSAWSKLGTLKAKYLTKITESAPHMVYRNRQHGLSSTKYWCCSSTKHELQGQSDRCIWKSIILCRLRR